MEPVQLAAVLAAVVVLASVISVEVGLSVALIELGLGVVVGNAFGLDPNADWLAFIATFASIVLTFLAGAEVDPDDFRERFGASMTIGLVSFVGPFAVAGLVAYGLLGWTLEASLIAGTALSTTSLAVVYAVLVETGLNATRIGKLIMSACFVTDMGTAIALSAIFVRPNGWFPVFLAVSVALIVAQVAHKEVDKVVAVVERAWPAAARACNRSVSSRDDRLGSPGRRTGGLGSL